MKGTATLDQRQKEALYRATHPDPTLSGDLRVKYVDAASELAQTATGVEGTLYEVFGPEFIGNLAFRLDPTSPFKFTSGYISGWNRKRVRSNNVYQRGVVIREDYVHLANYEVDLPLTHPTFDVVLEQVVIPPEEIQYSDLDLGPTYALDTTIVSRGPDSPFGWLALVEPKAYSLSTSGALHNYWVEESPLFDDPTKADRWYRHQEWNPSFHLAYPNGDVFTPAPFEWWAVDFMNSKYLSLLPKALANRRLFNLAYQLAELKDVPQMLRAISSLKNRVQALAKGEAEFRKSVRSIKGTAKRRAKSRGVDTSLDSFVSEQYLNVQFGILSLTNAIGSALSLPSRAAKKLNYLLSRNNKVTTSRYTEKVSLVSPMGSPPTFNTNLPDWALLLDETVNHRIDGELRMVINQTIKFPLAAVPQISDSNYRDLLGLVPTWSDLYNIIPWTWLVDWFSDLGSYIQVMENINSDKELINYGFLSFVGTEVVDHEFSVGVVNSTFSSDTVGSPFTYSGEVYTYRNRYERKFHIRVGLDILDGVKTLSQGEAYNLSAYQESILFALFSKFG